MFSFIGLTLLGVDRRRQWEIWADAFAGSDMFVYFTLLKIKTGAAFFVFL